MSLNKVMIIGNLGRDPEMRYTPNGQAVTQLKVPQCLDRRIGDVIGRVVAQVAFDPQAARQRRLARQPLSRLRGQARRQSRGLQRL